MNALALQSRPKAANWPLEIKSLGRPTTAPTDAQLIACDALVEFADVLAREATQLRDYAVEADVRAVEAKLWASKRVLTAAIKTWREVVPPLNDGGAQ
jgi:hypothetical protein